MSGFPLLDATTANERAATLLRATESALGRTPNLYRAMANSPAALDGYLAFRGALTKGTLSLKLREKIALLTAERNRCDYCVSAHSFRGAKIGLDANELDSVREGRSNDPRDAAALAFVDAVIAHGGRVEADALARVRDAGWSDEAIGEIVAHVALNVFSNYFNHIAEPELDFPRVEARDHG